MTTETFDLQPNITTDQAKRMSEALDLRQSCEEECRRLLHEMLDCAEPFGGKGRLIVNVQHVLAARELLAEWKVRNAAFEAAVFERH